MRVHGIGFLSPMEPRSVLSLQLWLWSQCSACTLWDEKVHAHTLSIISLFLWALFPCLCASQVNSLQTVFYKKIMEFRNFKQMSFATVTLSDTKFGLEYFKNSSFEHFLQHVSKNYRIPATGVISKQETG